MLRRVLLLTLAGVICCGDDENEKDRPPILPDPGCTPTLTTSTSGGATNVREVVIDLTATGCSAIDLNVRRDGLYVLATQRRGDTYRAWVVLDSGTNTFEVVAFVDGEEHVGPTVTFEYTAVAPTAGVESGYVVGEVFDAADDSPIQGAAVYLRGVTGEVQTDANGAYEFPTPEPGRYVLTIEAPGYTFAQRPFAVSTGTRRRVDPVYLVSLDTKTARITAEAGGTLMNTAGDVELVVPPGAVRGTFDVSAISFPKHETLPGPLPDSSRWTQAFNLSPDGVRFDSPAILRTENVLGFDPGTEVPVGYYNRELAAWEPEVMGVVSDDGAWIELQVTHFSPYDCNFPVREEPAPGSGEEKDDSNNCKKGNKGASLVNDVTGTLELFVPISQAVRGDRARAARLVYDSSQASGVTPFVFPIALGEIDGLEELKAELTLEGHHYTSSLAVSTSPTEVYFLGEQLEPTGWFGMPLASGIYSMQMHVTALATVNYMTADVFGGVGVEDTGVATREPVPFDNRRNLPIVIQDERGSPFGAGWRFEEEEQLLTHSSRDIVAWNRARGSSIIYMGYPDTLVLDAAPHAVTDDFVDFFILDDGRVVIVTDHAVHIAPDFASFDQATELASVTETIIMAALGNGGLALWVATSPAYGVRWVDLDGDVGELLDPIAALVADGTVPP